MIWLDLLTTVLLPSIAFGVGFAGLAKARRWRELYWGRVAREAWCWFEEATRERCRAKDLEKALATPCPRCGASRDVEVYR